MQRKEHNKVPLELFYKLCIETDRPQSQALEEEPVT